MQSITIHKLNLKYRLPSRDAEAVRYRLDRALREVLDSALEAALDGLGLPASAEICIRRMSVPIHLRLSDTQSSLARNWSATLAASLKRAANGDYVSGVVYYESRTQALFDLAQGVATGRLERAWAWQQLGLFRAGERADERQAREQFVSALCAEPRMILPVLSELADRQVLERLAPGLTAEQWTRLAQSALTLSGSTTPRATADDFRLAVDESFADFDARSMAFSSLAPHLLAPARRVLNASRLARVFTRMRSAEGTLAPGRDEFQIVAARAALVLMEVEPGIFSAASDASAALLKAVTSLLLQPGLPASLSHGEASPAASDEAHGAATSPDVRLDDSPRTGEPDADALPESVRQRAFTRFGGLLYLIGVVEDLGLPDEMLTHPSLRERTLRWTMQQVALRLLPLAASDAAALAFAGLRPEEIAPAEHEDPPGEAEVVAIDSFVGRIVRLLGERLERREQAADELLRLVCQRRAEIVAEPGWIDVRMSLDEVSTEIRRAGLDLNPGYVAWLGVVVRFVYE